VTESEERLGIKKIKTRKVALKKGGNKALPFQLAKNLNLFLAVGKNEESGKGGILPDTADVASNLRAKTLKEARTIEFPRVKEGAAKMKNYRRRLGSGGNEGKESLKTALYE